MLRSFWNDVVIAYCFDQPSYDYRQAVKKAIPQLEYLDDEPLLNSEHQHQWHTSDFDEDWKLIDKLVQDGMVFPEEKIDNVPGIFFISYYSNINTDERMED